jgi:hypothetical protein
VRGDSGRGAGDPPAARLKGLKVVLSSSTATGNGTAPICGLLDDCADLAAASRPRLAGASACDTSRDTENGVSWGVCAND